MPVLSNKNNIKEHGFLLNNFFWNSCKFEIPRDLACRVNTMNVRSRDYQFVIWLSSFPCFWFCFVSFLKVRFLLFFFLSFCCLTLGLKQPESLPKPTY